MTQALPRRTRRDRVVPVDTARFRPQIEQAMAAFSQDVDYAVKMARAAVTIVKKRQVWQARREARLATD